MQMSDVRTVEELIGYQYCSELAKGGVAHKDFVELMQASLKETDIQWICAKFFELGKIYGKREERAKKH